MWLFFSNLIVYIYLKDKVTEVQRIRNIFHSAHPPICLQEPGLGRGKARSQEEILDLHVSRNLDQKYGIAGTATNALKWDKDGPKQPPVQHLSPRLSFK